MIKHFWKHLLPLWITRTYQLIPEAKRFELFGGMSTSHLVEWDPSWPTFWKAIAINNPHIPHP